jgi:hypothetical protein
MESINLIESTPLDTLYTVFLGARMESIDLERPFHWICIMHCILRSSYGEYQSSSSS